MMYRVFGEMFALADLALLTGAKPSTIISLLRSGKTAEQVVAIAKGRSKAGEFVAGKIFNRLTIVAELPSAEWHCRCSCGNEHRGKRKDILSGRTKSCGCLSREMASVRRIGIASDLTGKEFADGHVKVIEIGEFVTVTRRGGTAQVRLWKCLCKCGKQFSAKAAALARGQITSCGCRAHFAKRQKESQTRIRVDGLSVAELSDKSGLKPCVIYARMYRGVNGAELTAESNGPKLYELEGEMLTAKDLADIAQVSVSVMISRLRSKTAASAIGPQNIARDLAGKRFGRLVAVEKVGRSRGQAMWRCRCDCGLDKVALSNNLRRGITRSCGCLRRDRGALNL